MLTADGRVMAKLYHYWGYCGNYNECDRSWRYEIAEGTYTIIDRDICFVELHWRKWAERKAFDENTAERPSLDELSPWEAMCVDEVRQPHHMVPSRGGQAS